MKIKRIVCAVLALILLLGVCTALLACEKNPPAEEPGGEPGGEQPAKPDLPDEGKETEKRQDGDTYRY